MGEVSTSRYSVKTNGLGTRVLIRQDGLSNAKEEANHSTKTSGYLTHFHDSSHHRGITQKQVRERYPTCNKKGVY